MLLLQWNRFSSSHKNKSRRQWREDTFWRSDQITSLLQLLHVLHVYCVWSTKQSYSTPAWTVHVNTLAPVATSSASWRVTARPTELDRCVMKVAKAALKTKCYCCIFAFIGTQNSHCVAFLLWFGVTFTTCSDIDECTTSPCQNGATCNNLETGFECDCAYGYEGDRCETGKI